MKSKSTRYMVQLALLSAVLVVLNVTPLGFIPLPTIHITLMHLPVVIGAITLGPAAGGFLGGLFGLMSMITATVRGTPDAIVFSPFLSHSLWSVVIAMVPRILLGLITAWLFLGFEKTKLSPRLSAGISAGVGTFLHTVFVLGSIYLFLGERYARETGIAYTALLAAFLTVISTNGVVEALVAVLIAMALVVPLQKLNKEY